MAKHLIEMAKALVEISDGKIEVKTEPLIRRCPLRSELYGCHEESRVTVERVLKEHMRDFGMYRSDRILEIDQKPVSFGASEIIMDAMKEGLVDAAVVVCEGAGTVVINEPDVLQAVGAHMTGLLSTEPIKEIQDGLKLRHVVLLDDKCIIDQFDGYSKAMDLGFKNVAVTISGHRAFDAKRLREMGQAYDTKPIILSVHNTGISEEEARALAKYCDIIWSCASKSVREVAGKLSKIQIGISIPVFGITQIGKRLILNRALNFEEGLIIHRANLPYVPSEKQPNPLM
jgi:putative methanogenesis marker protein 8